MDGSDGGEVYGSPKELKKSKSVLQRGGAAALGCAGGFFGGLRDYLMRGNVVDLAVAVVVGQAFTDLVTAVVSDWLTPAVAILFNPEALFASLTFTVRGSIFPYGHFLNALLSFVLILLIVVFLVVAPMNAIFTQVAPSTRTRVCPECLSDIPQKARRCKFCCAAVEPPGLSKKILSFSANKPVVRAQSLPVGGVLPVGQAPLQTSTSLPANACLPVIAGPSLPPCLSPHSATNLSKAALLESVPENNCLPSPESSAAAEALALVASGSPSAAAEAAAASTAMADDEAPPRRAAPLPIFKSSSIKMSSLEPASQYSWLPAPAAAAAAAGAAADTVLAEQFCCWR